MVDRAMGYCRESAQNPQNRSADSRTPEKCSSRREEAQICQVFGPNLSVLASAATLSKHALTGGLRCTKALPGNELIRASLRRPLQCFGTDSVIRSETRAVRARVARVRGHVLPRELHVCVRQNFVQTPPRMTRE